jgi:hypothetical protein
MCTFVSLVSGQDFFECWAPLLERCMNVVLTRDIQTECVRDSLLYGVQGSACASIEQSLLLLQDAAFTLETTSLRMLYDSLSPCD